MSGPIVILYVILGSGFLILCAAGISYTLRAEEPHKFMAEEQRAYLREVRERNFDALAASVPTKDRRDVAPRDSSGSSGMLY